MLATLDERPIPRALPLWRDPDLSRESASTFDGSFPANDGLEPSLNLDDHLIRHPDSTFLVRVVGEALADASLHDGDLLVMDRATPPLAGSVALAVVEGVAVLTRLSRDARGRLRASAAESGFGPPLDRTTIVGVARWVIRRLWPGRLSS
jgi:DNA polymerase V